MPQEKVEVTRHLDSSADAVWGVVRQFCVGWHPLIETIHAETDQQQRVIRAFTVRGETTRYREQLTYRSDTDRRLQYSHLSGIEGADSYHAGIDITSTDNGGSIISWTAEVSATGARAKEIATGSAAIFHAGIDALAGLSAAPPAAQDGARFNAGQKSSPLKISGTPALTVSVSPRGDGPLCLFLHGIGGSRCNWDAQLAVTGSIMRTAALDLRGYGDSEAGSRQTTVDDYCADILRVCEQLGAEKLVLCGLSYGAWIATSFAMRFADKLAGLILSGGCTGMSEATSQARDAFRQSREAPLNAGLAPADFAADVVDIISGPDADKASRKKLHQSMAAITPATYRDALNCFTHPPERFDFSCLTMPVLMMTGEYDRLAPPAEIRSVAQRIVTDVAKHGDPYADVQFEVISDAGHVCNVEQPDDFNARLLSFLARMPT